jgi:hypothetical protein
MEIRRCITIATTSRYVNAYFSLFLSITTNGRHSRSLWGPGDGLGAYTINPHFWFTPFEGTSQLVEHPVLGRIEPLQMLLQTASLKRENATQTSVHGQNRGSVSQPQKP